MLSPEVQSQFAVWRQKSLEGTITLEEMKAAVAALRGDRRAAAAAATGGKSRSSRAAPRAADDMLGELGIG